MSSGGYGGGWGTGGGGGPHGPGAPPGHGHHPGAHGMHPGHGVHPGAYGMHPGMVAHGVPGFGHGPAGVHHEFGPAENATIGSTATWAKALGIVGFVDVGLDAINLNVVGAAIAFAIALAFWKAGSSLSSVATTQGHDVPHLMQAMQQVGSAFHTRTIVTLLAAGLVLVVAIGVVVVAAVAAAR